MRKIFIVIAAVVVAAAIAAGSFYGGMAYQRNQTNNIRNSFLRSRGINPEDGAQGFGGGFFGGQGGGNGSQGGRAFGGGAAGQVKSIDGNVLTLSTAQNVTTVNLTSSTRIEKTTTGTTTDIQPGQRVIVNGDRDSNGNITAVQITVLETIPVNSTPAP